MVQEYRRNHFCNISLTHNGQKMEKKTRSSSEEKKEEPLKPHTHMEPVTYRNAATFCSLYPRILQILFPLQPWYWVWVNLLFHCIFTDIDIHVTGLVYCKNILWLFFFSWKSLRSVLLKDKSYVSIVEILVCENKTMNLFEFSIGLLQLLRPLVASLFWPVAATTTVITAHSDQVLPWWSTILYQIQDSVAVLEV